MQPQPNDFLEEAEFALRALACSERSEGYSRLRLAGCAIGNMLGSRREDGSAAPASRMTSLYGGSRSARVLSMNSVRWIRQVRRASAAREGCQDGVNATAGPEGLGRG